MADAKHPPVEAMLPPTRLTVRDLRAPWSFVELESAEMSGSLGKVAAVVSAGLDGQAVAD